MRTIEWNADPDVKVDFGIILDEVQKKNFLHNAVRCFNIPVWFLSCPIKQNSIYSKFYSHIIK